jgi:hypothetical protein
MIINVLYICITRIKIKNRKYGQQRCFFKMDKDFGQQPANQQCQKRRYLYPCFFQGTGGQKPFQRRIIDEYAAKNNFTVLGHYGGT